MIAGATAAIPVPATLAWPKGAVQRERDDPEPGGADLYHLRQ
jgi:hypothetical protein